MFINRCQKCKAKDELEAYLVGYTFCQNCGNVAEYKERLA